MIIEMLIQKPDHKKQILETSMVLFNATKLLYYALKQVHLNNLLHLLQSEARHQCPHLPDRSAKCD